MKTLFDQFSRLQLFLVVIGLLFSLLTACSTPAATSEPIPSLTPDPTATQTPISPSATVEPEADGESEAILLPTVTLAPTSTPDLVTELIQQVSQTLGVQDVKVLRVSAGLRWKLRGRRSTSSSRLGHPFQARGNPSN